MRDDEIARLPDLIRGLLSLDAYQHPVDHPVEVIQTHISYVLLAGEFAYKVKKALDLGFLDYSTLERRKRMCEEEVRLNRRLCPDAYLGTAPIVVEGGRVRIEAGGEPVEYAVKMRRIDAARMMPELLDRRAVSRDEIVRIARFLADVHARAGTSEEIAAYGGAGGVRRNWDENFAQVAAFAGRTIDRAAFDAMRAWVERWLSGNATLLSERASEGRVRDCHGDLRADSIVIHPDGSICVMDCIEFNERLRCTDVAADLAFLAMDLDYRGRRDLSDELVSGYLAVAPDETMTLVMPFYKSYRAFVRGKVESLTAAEPEVPGEQRGAAVERARRYFSLAAEYATALPWQALTVMVGLTGSGKSHLAHALAARISAAVVSSDVVRGGRDDAAPPAGFGAGRYSDERRRAAYQRMRERAGEHLSLGRSVVLDATHIARRERDAARELAAAHGLTSLFVHVPAGDDLARERLAARAREGRSASEGRWEIYVEQKAAFEPPDEAPDDQVVVVDAAGALSDNVARIVERLSR